MFGRIQAVIFRVCSFRIWRGRFSEYLHVLSKRIIMGNHNRTRNSLVICFFRLLIEHTSLNYIWFARIRIKYCCMYPYCCYNFCCTRERERERERENTLQEFDSMLSWFIISDLTAFCWILDSTIHLIWSINH